MQPDDIATLLSPFTLGSLTLRNRIVMAPLTRSRSSQEGVPPSFAAQYYAQRASAGLIISEATNISPQARGYEYTPGIWTDAQASSWHNVTQAVHEAGGRIFLQLWHTGRLSHPALQPGHALPVSASAIRPEGQAFTADGMKDYVTPRPLETEEVPRVVHDYRHAAANARKAGFDGVEIHAANNYLLDQFIRDSTNRRTDRYGGSVENRLRFPLEVAQAVLTVWEPRQVGIHLSPFAEMPGKAPLDSDVMGTYGALLAALGELNLGYLHMVEGNTQISRDPPAGIDYQTLRRRFRGAYIANNLYTPDMAAQAVRKGDADLISFGRPYLSNPDLVERIRRNAPFNDTAPKETWYGGDAEGYIDFPTIPVPTTVA
jgi:N-ethylmaleimide reductase